jgi:hypothetical protein
MYPDFNKTVTKSMAAALPAKLDSNQSVNDMIRQANNRPGIRRYTPVTAASGPSTRPRIPKAPADSNLFSAKENALIDNIQRQSGVRAPKATAAAPVSAVQRPAPAAQPVTAPVATGVREKTGSPMQAGNYWIDSAGNKRSLSWDKAGTITSGLRDANDPAVKADRARNRSALMRDTM